MELKEMKKNQVEMVAAKLGIDASKAKSLKILKGWISEELEDLNIHLEAIANVKKDGVAKSPGKKKGSVYKGKDLVTGKKLYG